jgi:hypothetical protein
VSRCFNPTPAYIWYLNDRLIREAWLSSIGQGWKELSQGPRAGAPALVDLSQVISKFLFFDNEEVGAALTLDDFALWLRLEDVYWSREGRESIDAVILFSTLLLISAVGAAFFRATLREAARPFKK